MRDKLPCPDCGDEIPLVFEWPSPETLPSQGGQIVVSLASGVYHCPKHGHFRIYISGAYAKVTLKQRE